jgi:hypothetical protein
MQSSACCLLLAGFLCSLKMDLTSQRVMLTFFELHSVHAQKSEFFMTTAVGPKYSFTTSLFHNVFLLIDHLSGLVVRVPGSGFDSLRYKIFWEVLDLERGPLSLVNTIEELLERKSSGSGLKNRGYGHMGSGALTTRHPSIRKSWH